VKTFEAITQRRSVKHYDPQHKLTDKEKQKLLSLAMFSPTSFNIQHVRFVTVEDPQLRQKIREVSWDQAQVTEASLLIILCADLKAWDKEPERYWLNAPKDVQKEIVPMIGQYYREREQEQRDEAMRSCGITAQTLMLAAKSMGYDSCPMVGFDFAKVADLINLPEDHIISMFVVIGKAVKEAQPRSGSLPIEEVVVEDRFN